MASPIKSIGSAIGRIFTLPGSGGQPAPQPINIPPPPPPTQQPMGTRPTASATQMSFLSAASRAGVAAGQAAGTSGKTLLGS